LFWAGRKVWSVSLDRVRDVTQFFAIGQDEQDEEEEQLVYDEFLKELIERRTSAEFKNIVFSIQKAQGAIISEPYNQNLIVQGCAGSGKSMILLHRLPILLYDNEKTLKRNNIYMRCLAHRI